MVPTGLVGVQPFSYSICKWGMGVLQGMFFLLPFDLKGCLYYYPCKANNLTQPIQASAMRASCIWCCNSNGFYRALRYLWVTLGNLGLAWR